MITVISVASSNPTHITPMLLAIRARFIEPIIAWNIAW